MLKHVNAYKPCIYCSYMIEFYVSKYYYYYYYTKYFKIKKIKNKAVYYQNTDASVQHCLGYSILCHLLAARHN